jgi:hypothetical protein
MSPTETTAPSGCEKDTATANKLARARRTISSASAAIRIDHHYVLYDSFRSFCVDKEPAVAKRSRDKAAFHLAEERVNVEQAVCHRPHSKTVTWLVVLLASR